MNKNELFIREWIVVFFLISLIGCVVFVSHYKRYKMEAACRNYQISMQFRMIATKSCVTLRNFNV